LGLDQSMESEGHDREDIDLPAAQYQLVTQLRQATSKPIIGILIHGGTVALYNLTEQLDAILDAWYPSQEGGNAIADVLFGNYNPAGRAAVTYYQTTSQLGPMGQMDLYAGNGTTYRYFNGEPQYPFGYGLSYTTFAYSNLQLNNTNPKACDIIGVTVTVENTGSMDGDEVVQLYVSTPQSSQPTPNIRLGDFERVTIAAGQSMNVNLTLKPWFHAVIYDGPNIYNATVFVESGPLNIYVGGGQPKYYPGNVNTVVTVQNYQELHTCNL